MRNITHVQLGLAVASMNFRDSESFILKQSLGAAAVRPDGLRAAAHDDGAESDELRPLQPDAYGAGGDGTGGEIRHAFISGCFDACTNGASFRTARVREDEQHVFLPEIIPQRLLGAVIRNGDCR